MCSRAWDQDLGSFRDGGRMTRVSAIICAHNPRPEHLRRVLDALRDQTLPNDQWELLLIDNASRQPLASEWDLSWHPHARHVLEPELGLSAARRRGMREASADILLFVDDDNVLAPDYLAEGLRVAAEWPQMGTWGSGSLLPEYEVEPAERLRPLLYLLAIREVDAARWTNVFQIDACPWGAGIFLRRSVADTYRHLSRDEGLPISDRKGASLTSGGDVELSYVACSAGLGIGIFPELKVTHLIPGERLAHDYLMRLHEGIAISTRLILYKWEKALPNSQSRLRRGLSIFKNFLVLRGVEREMYFSTVRADRKSRNIIDALPSADRSVHGVGGGAGAAGTRAGLESAGLL
ncbi:Glycosyltransferase, GT2 family [Rhizobiales bacterium GAS188]|nr:Glycosyltransferase, GT2 family [Rhizobiales bacterium GAS188]